MLLFAVPLDLAFVAEVRVGLWCIILLHGLLAIRFKWKQNSHDGLKGFGSAGVFECLGEDL